MDYKTRIFWAVVIFVGVSTLLFSLSAGVYGQDLQVQSPTWGVSLTNSLSYSIWPLQKLKNTANFSAYLRVQDQRFSLQLKGNAADYPGFGTKPLLDKYFLRLDQYILSWQTKLFELQYGQVNVPLDSGLVQLGLGFKGLLLQSAQQRGKGWIVFQGELASSSGFGISTQRILGGSYRWQTGANQHQVTILELEKETARVIALKDDRIFSWGVLRSEFVYGWAGESGGALSLQGATSLGGVNWHSGLSLVGKSFPLGGLLPMTGAQRGGYQLNLGGNKLLPRDLKINFSLSHSADNLSGKSRQTKQNQSWQLNLNGFFTPSFSWQAGYQGATSLQHLLRLSLNRRLDDGNLSFGLTFGSNSLIDTREYRLNLGYSQAFKNRGLKLTSSLELSQEIKVGNSLNTLKIRLGLDQNLYGDQLKGNFSGGYQLKSGSSELSLDGALDYRFNEDHNIRLSGKMTLWQKEKGAKRGVDYSMSVGWHARVF